MARQYRRNPDFNAMSDDDMVALAQAENTPTTVLLDLLAWIHAKLSDRFSLPLVKRCWRVEEAIYANPCCNPQVWKACKFASSLPLLKNIMFPSAMLSDPGIVNEVRLLGAICFDAAASKKRITGSDETPPHYLDSDMELALATVELWKACIEAKKGNFGISKLAYIIVSGNCKIPPKLNKQIKACLVDDIVDMSPNRRRR